MGMVGRSDRKWDYDFDFRDLEGFAYLKVWVLVFIPVPNLIPMGKDSGFHAPI